MLTPKSEPPREYSVHTSKRSSQSLDQNPAGGKTNHLTKGSERARETFKIIWLSEEQLLLECMVMTRSKTVLPG
jgi:hypothetical protein